MRQFRRLWLILPLAAVLVFSGLLSFSLVRMFAVQNAMRVGAELDLSRFDAAPLIAFTATKETNYGHGKNG